MDQDRTWRILRQHLETDRLLGIEEVYRGEATRPLPPPAFNADPKRGPASEATRPAARARPVRPAADVEQPVSKGDSPPDAGPAGPISEPATRDAKLRLLTTMDETEVKGCTRCELCRSRTHTVFGEGDPDAAIMFIGEGPGQSEDETGRPFVGKAGELLDKMIVAMGQSRESVYIANVVKCRPPSNRTPTPAEAATCSTYLHRQIAWIRPRVIVTLGGSAAKLLLDTSEGITRLRGQWREYAAVDPAIPVMPTFHPAYLLRSYTKDNREKVWSDLQAVMERLA